MRDRKWSLPTIVALILVLVSSVVSIGYAQTTPAGSKPTARQPWPAVISFASSGEATSTYAVAAGMTTLINKYMKIKAVPEASSVGGKTLYQLHNKEVELAHSLGDAAYEAVRGLGPFKSVGKMNIRQMISGTLTGFAMVTRAGSGIKTMSDLRGKKVQATHPGNHTFTRAMDVFLDAEGMTRADFIDLKFLGSRDTERALKERTADASVNAIPVVGVPAWMEQLNREVPLYVFAPSIEKLGRVLPKYPFMDKTAYLAKYMGKMVDNKDAPSIGCISYVLCQTDLSEDFVYQAMKAIFDHLEELYPFHADAKHWTDTPLATTVTPYHPGAIKFYKEKGWWTAEVNEMNNKMLREIGVSR